MPSLSEFKLTMRPIESAFSDSVDVVFHFQSVRTFRSFRYIVDLDIERNVEEGTIRFVVKGVRTDSTMMSRTGHASSEVVIEEVANDCRVMIHGSGDGERTEFDMLIGDGEIAIQNISGSGGLLVEASDTPTKHAG
jgi:hypothetical protein